MLVHVVPAGWRLFVLRKTHPYRSGWDHVLRGELDNADYGRCGCGNGAATPRSTSTVSSTTPQRIEKSDGTVAAEGIVTIVTVDPDTRRAVLLPEELAGLFRGPD